jgi:hypothetical protein
MKVMKEDTEMAESQANQQQANKETASTVITIYAVVLDRNKTAQTDRRRSVWHPAMLSGIPSYGAGQC